MTTETITETGCYLDSHRGHYAVRDCILLAEEYGYILDGFKRFVLAQYDDHYHEEDYPDLIELCDDAVAWLNCGENTGVDRPIRGQNSPPVIPAGYSWGWNDGDFGLYADDEDDW